MQGLGGGDMGGLGDLGNMDEMMKAMTEAGFDGKGLDGMPPNMDPKEVEAMSQAAVEEVSYSLLPYVYFFIAISFPFYS
jgi:hypothetical protein